MGRLTGKVALITGAGSGIGLSIAKAFAQEGAHLGINDLLKDQAITAVNMVRESGGEAIALPADVSIASQVQILSESLLNRFGRIDILVNNAGGGRIQPFLEITIEDWDTMINKNLRSVFLCTKFVLPSMLENKFGRIINISSQLAFKGAIDHVHYCSAKGGIVAFTKALALEVANKGITVNTIAPGATNTPGHKAAGVTDEWRQKKIGEIPLGRFAEVEQIAPTAVLLATSPDGDAYTGQTFHPNGGEVML